jgi:uncharacterized membrane protein YiaA
MVNESLDKGTNCGRGRRITYGKLHCWLIILSKIKFLFVGLFNIQENLFSIKMFLSYQAKT